MAPGTRPVYLRLRDLIADGILDGTYREGAMLPSVRGLAAEQGANPLTVAKAYQHFQEAGLVVARRGIGMEVASGAPARLRQAERAEFLAREWPVIAARMRRLGIGAAELWALEEEVS